MYFGKVLIGKPAPVKFKVTFSATQGQSITFRLQAVTGTSMVIDWGDGEEETFNATAASYVDVSHTFASASSGIVIHYADNLKYFGYTLTSHSISFNLRNTPRNLVTLRTSGSNTISGSLADAPANLTYLFITGSNTISGSLADAPANLTDLLIAGSNTISGNIADAPANVTELNIQGSNTINDYTQGKTFAMNFYRLIKFGSQGLPQAKMINLIVDISAATWGSGSKQLNMPSPNASMANTTQGGIWGDFSGAAAPSALATAYKTLIKTKTVLVTLNGIVVPGVSGDGTGFPAGFGNWYRT